MDKQLYKLLIDAVDNEGPFFQNFYVYGKTTSDTINSLMRYLEKMKYKNIKVVEIESFEINYIPDDVIETDEFDGYIQNIKFGYPIEDLEE